jgi:hypothetical protein
MKFGWRDLWRVSLWAVSAAAAMALAVYAGTTEIGRDRVHHAFAEVREILVPSGIKPVRPLDAREGRHLADTVRALAADRERLLARIATLEQGMDGITGSIARVEKSVQTLQQPPEITAPDARPATPPPDEVTSSISPPASVPLPPSPPSPNAGKSEFGVDLGSASTVDALRTAWTVALRRHGGLLEGLHPVVQMRERPRPAAVEFRLIAGPIPNAAGAARICAVMTASGSVCAPAAFDGQRLAVR